MQSTDVLRYKPVDWHLSKAFAIEASKRQLQACQDIEQLRAASLNLLLQVVALQEMTAVLLLRDQ
jgi:hypothetical protein